MAYYGSGPIKELVIQAQKKRKKKDDNLCPRGVYILVEGGWKEMKNESMYAKCCEEKEAGK